jgi:hypothetical protein
VQTLQLFLENEPKEVECFNIRILLGAILFNMRADQNAIMFTLLKQQITHTFTR